MRDNAGFLALGSLAIVLIFFGLRGFDETGKFNPLREPPRPVVLTDDGEPSSVIVRARRDGHFLLDTKISGRRASMLVDTGASVVTLRESDARKGGLSIKRDDYRIPFSTANGTVLGAPAVLAELTIGPVVLKDLRVVVLPDDKLETSLFGTNGLNRFARRETTRDELILYTD